MAAFLNLTNETVPTGPNGNAVIILLTIKLIYIIACRLPNIHFNVSSGNSFARRITTGYYTIQFHTLSIRYVLVI